MKETFKPVEVDLKVIVKVIEFVRPKGHQVQHIVHLPNDYWHNCEMIGREQLRFTLEHLDNGTSCIALENQKLGDYNCVLTTSELWQEAIPRLIREFNKKDYERWERGFQ